MTADEFKKELFWTFNLNLTKEVQTFTLGGKEITF